VRPLFEGEFSYTPLKEEMTRMAKPMVYTMPLDKIGLVAFRTGLGMRQGSRIVDLKAIRETLGMRREDLAVETGMSFDSIGRFERTKRMSRTAVKLLEGVLSKRGQLKLLEQHSDQGK
jgi:hypothetical protein